jgi:hypothetical protein
MAEPGVVPSNGSATLLHVETIQTGQLIRFEVGSRFGASPYQVLPTAPPRLSLTAFAGLASIRKTCRQSVVDRPARRRRSVYKCVRNA